MEGAVRERISSHKEIMPTVSLCFMHTIAVGMQNELATDMQTSPMSHWDPQLRFRHRLQAQCSRRFRPIA